MINATFLRFAAAAPFLLLALAASGCKSLGDAAPSIESVKPRITGIDLQGVELSFDVAIRNSLPLAIRTPKYSYAFDIQGTPFAKADDAAGIDLPASGRGTATLPIRIGYQELARIVGDLGKVNEASYGLSGAFRIPALGTTYDLPFSHKGTFPVVKAPRFGVVDVKTSGLSLSGASVEVVAEMSNPNAFAIGIDDLGYALSLGGGEIAGLKATTGGEVASGATKKFTLTGGISARDVLAKLLGGGKLTGAKIAPTGSIGTPYGPIRLR